MHPNRFLGIDTMCRNLQYSELIYRIFVLRRRSSILVPVNPNELKEARKRVSAVTFQRGLPDIIKIWCLVSADNSTSPIPAFLFQVIFGHLEDMANNFRRLVDELTVNSTSSANSTSTAGTTAFFCCIVAFLGTALTLSAKPCMKIV